MASAFQAQENEGLTERKSMPLQHNEANTRCQAFAPSRIVVGTSLWGMQFLNLASVSQDWVKDYLA